MDTQRNNGEEATTAALVDKAIDTGRRRLSTAGIAGTGVLFSVTSRSAMGGWGSCTGSEIASGNLSRHGDPNPCGCSPGFWWASPHGPNLWTTLITPNYPKFSREAYFNKVFGRKYFKPAPGPQLKDVGPGSGEPTIAMHAVAALLNAAFYGSRYPAPYQTPEAVIAAFKAAFDGGENALNAFKSAVDIYDSKNTWCFGDT